MRGYRLVSLLLSAGLGFATSRAVAQPREYDGERGVEASVSVGYGALVNGTARVLQTPMEAAPGSTLNAYDAGGVNLRVGAGYRFAPFLSAGFYGQFQSLEPTAASATYVRFGGFTALGVYARVYLARLLIARAASATAPLESLTDSRRFDPWFGLGFEFLENVWRRDVGPDPVSNWASTSRRSVGIPVMLGVDVRPITPLAVGLTFGLTPMFGGRLDRSAVWTDGQGNVQTTSTSAQSVDGTNAHWYVGLSARFTWTHGV